MFFATHTSSVQRIVEEYPYHLEQIGDIQTLRKTLLNIDYFMVLYTDRHQSDLFHYWHVVNDPIDKIADAYYEALNLYMSSNPAGDVASASP